LRSPGRKVSPLCVVRSSNKEIFLELNVDVDVLRLHEVLSLLQRFEHSDLEINQYLNELFQLYRTPFLHFIDNFWVITYRELLEDLLANTLIKLLIFRRLNLHTRIKLINLLATTLSTWLTFSDLPKILEFHKVKVPTLRNLFMESNTDRNIVPVRIVSVNNAQRLDLFKVASSIFPLSSDEYLIYINSSELEKFVSGGNKPRDVLR